VTTRWGGRTGKSLSRTHLPLTLAWAIAIHKSQEITLDETTIDIGNKNFSSGLSVVAIS
jgi:ATP-dependent exoDNAse (exonuclease V) alpha subunit